MCHYWFICVSYFPMLCAEVVDYLYSKPVASNCFLVLLLLLIFDLTKRSPTAQYRCEIVYLFSAICCCCCCSSVLRSQLQCKHCKLSSQQWKREGERKRHLDCSVECPINVKSAAAFTLPIRYNGPLKRAHLLWSPKCAPHCAQSMRTLTPLFAFYS